MYTFRIQELANSAFARLNSRSGEGYSALLAFFCLSKVKSRFPYQKENIRFDITFEELTPVTKVLQVFPSIFEENQAIGRESIQGSRGAVGKPTALEGYPTSQLYFEK